MTRAYPPDVIVLDLDSLLHARFALGKGKPRLEQAKSYRLAPGTFTPSLVTPQLALEGGLTEGLRRLKAETGKWQKVSVLLPDSWFRINIIELPALPAREAEAQEIVQWSLKRTLPIPPDQLRVSWVPLSRNGETARVLVLSALEATLAAIERAFTAAELEVVLIEPVGLNVWNAVLSREDDSTAERLFVHVRDDDFTTAVFRGSEPLFIRSRNLSGDRTIEQELRLSATYLRDSLNVGTFSSCRLAGRQDPSIQRALEDAFDARIQPVVLSDFAEVSLPGLRDVEAELTACTGVFTG